VAAVYLMVKVQEAKADPNHFIEFCFTDPSGTPIRQAKVHRELQDFLSAHRQALVELPRDHGKSTQVCGRILWELGRRPALRVKVVCASTALAEDRGRFLREAIEENARVRLIFPKLRAGKPWSATRFTVRRPASAIGPSVTALGVGVASTGSRADLLVCDDIVDVRALRSPAERERVGVFFSNNLMNLLEPDGRCWCLFTPWHRSDLNAELKKNPAYSHFQRAVGENLEPVWPERWPRERLAERLREIGPTSFARGYKLLPAAEGDAAIQPGWIKYWTRAEEYEQIVLAVDPAVSLDAKADCSALVVLGQTADRKVHCLQAQAFRVEMHALINHIRDFDRRWQPQTILVETNSAFEIVKQNLQREQPFGYKVQGVKQTSSKASRIAMFGSQIQAASCLLQGIDAATVDPAQQQLFDQMIAFPAGDHDDLVDAAAMGTEYLLSQREPGIRLLGEGRSDSEW
jgi:predicted phage terminase large subunit-like protein